jgi:hypothetical protein
MGFINEAGWDRIVRVIAGAVILYLGWAGVVTGGWGTFLKVFGFLPLLTGLFGFCPVYRVFGISTCRSAKQPV